MVGRDMKPRSLLVLVAGGFAVAVIVALAASIYWDRKQTPFQNAPKLISALRAFSRDQASSSRRLPPEIALQDLLRRGYLTTNDVRAFEGMDVTFNTQADDTFSSIERFVIAERMDQNPNAAD